MRCNISEYTIVNVEYTDPDCIKSALKELKYEFEEHEEASHLYGYSGDKRKEKANIIIRKKNVGSAANDVGFRKKANGQYELIISEYDRSGNKNQSVNFMEKMIQLYAKHISLKKIKKLGKTPFSIKVDDKNRVVIKVRAWILS